MELTQHRGLTDRGLVPERQRRPVRAKRRSSGSEAVHVWQGGLGIWGAIAGGAVGVWFACRQLQIPFRVVQQRPSDRPGPGCRDQEL